MAPGPAALGEGAGRKEEQLPPFAVVTEMCPLMCKGLIEPAGGDTSFSSSFP